MPLGERVDLGLVEVRRPAEAVHQHDRRTVPGALDLDSQLLAVDLHLLTRIVIVVMRSRSGDRLRRAPRPVIATRRRRRAEEPGRVEPDPDPGRGTGGDDVAGQQRDPGREDADQLGDVEDQVVDRCRLAGLAVDVALDLQRGHVGDLVGADRPRPHRAVGVQRLAEQPLLVVALQVAGGDVVDDRVAPHVVDASAG